MEGDVIIINRELNELDLFVRDFLEIVKKHTNYLIVSGFVSISTGRTRGTEDVDILLPILEKKEFKEFFNDLIKKDFWCYQTDDSDEAYGYTKRYESLRFTRKETLFPNMECVPIDKTRKAKYFEYSHPQKIRIDGFEFNIPWIEFEILYKEIILAGEKDIADAIHLRDFFKNILKKERFEESEEVIRRDLDEK